MQTIQSQILAKMVELICPPDGIPVTDGVQSRKGNQYPNSKNIDLEKHINGRSTYAIDVTYKDASGYDTCKWGIIDIDEGDEGLIKAKQVMDFLNENGIKAVISNSGRKGYHVYLFTQPVPKQIMVDALKKIKAVLPFKGETIPGNNIFNNEAGAQLISGAAILLGAGNSLSNAGLLSPGASAYQITHIDGNFIQTDSGQLEMQINADGGHDQLLVTGAASLGGTLGISKPFGYYRNGTVYDIIRTTDSGAISGDFDNIVLPESTPLLNFGINQQTDVFEVVVDAASFTTTATNQPENTVAEYLDRIAPSATGDLYNVLGEIQLLQLSQFSPAYSSLNPIPYDNSALACLGSARQHTQSLKWRINNLRSFAAAEHETQSKPVLLALAGSDVTFERLLSPEQLSHAQNRTGLWMTGYDQWSEQQGKQGFAGFDYRVFGGNLGLDHWFGDNLIAGLSFGYSRTDVDFDRNDDDSYIISYTGSLYGSYFLKNAYFEGTLSYGRSAFNNHRRLTIGSMQRRAYSEHDGDLYSAYVGTGYNYSIDNWLIRPFASLRYIHLNEEGFTEKGAESLNLEVEPRTTDSLESELGIRAARVFKTGYGNLIPEVSVALGYDFDIDDRVIRASFAGSPDVRFSIQGQNVDKYGWITAAGVTYVHKSGFSCSLKYGGEFRDNYTSHGLMGQIRFSF
jgi:outer membrane autotransporter protein